MKFSAVVSSLALLLATNALPISFDLVKKDAPDVISPKVFVINMFEYEAKPWLAAMNFTNNMTIPGLSPMYPDIFCNDDYSVCEMTTGEGEINASGSVTALGLSPKFNLTQTYFMISGIGGGEPTLTTMGSVTFAKYAVQVALQYQVSYQEFITTNPNWTSGYWAYGTTNPWSYPGNVYGTEVFELNEKLRDRAVELAESVPLNNGTDQNAVNRMLYDQDAARSLPSVVKCDVLTSDNYFTGNVLGDYFAFYASLMTNGSAQYCSTAQEDNASLEALTRLDKAGLVDFSRIVVMRTISDFTRPPPSRANDTVAWFNDPQSGGASAAFKNLPIAGIPFVNDVLTHWDDVYMTGESFAPTNYIGDIFNTLGGTPDFGKSSFDVA